MTLPLNDASFTSMPFMSFSVKLRGAGLPASAASFGSLPSASAAGGGAFGSISGPGINVSSTSATPTAAIPSQAFCFWLSRDSCGGDAGSSDAGVSGTGSGGVSLFMAPVHYHPAGATVHESEDGPPCGRSGRPTISGTVPAEGSGMSFARFGRHI